MPSRVPFLDINIISLRPRHTVVCRKPTHGAAYVPWLANQPRHITLGWITVESIGYARIDSHQDYFLLYCERPQLATRRPHYPQSVVHKQTICWQGRWCWVKPTGTNDAPSPSRVEVVGGRVVNTRVHGLLCGHHSIISIGWARVLYCLHKKPSFIKIVDYLVSSTRHRLWGQFSGRAHM